METLLAHLESSRQAFVDEVRDLSPEQCAARPSDEVWSILDVIEHIATVEIGVLEVFRTRMFAQPCPAAYKEQTLGKDQLILDVMGDRVTRRKSPDLVKPAGRWPDSAAALAAFDQARTAMIALVKGETRDLRNYYAPHPSLKALDAYQWLLFITTHTDRHREQIADLKATRE